MAGKALDTGKAQLTAILAKLPESLRAAVSEAFTKPEAEEALTTLGDTTLARSDYSKMMDDLSAKEQQIVADYNRLNTWYDGVKPKVEKYDTLEAEIARLKGDPLRPREVTSGTTPTGLSREDLDKILQERDQGYAGVLGLSNALSVQHFKDFQEVLDLSGLMQLSATKRISLSEAYAQQFGERIKARDDAAEEARINKLVEEKYAAAIKAGATQPFPLRGSPSVLDVLENPADKPANHTLDTAVQEYERLSATRGF